MMKLTTYPADPPVSSVNLFLIVDSLERSRSNRDGLTECLSDGIACGSPPDVATSEHGEGPAIDSDVLVADNGSSMCTCQTETDASP
eukprot:2376390-Rhodomonas_salina.2